MKMHVARRTASDPTPPTTLEPRLPPTPDSCAPKADAADTLARDTLLWSLDFGLVLVLALGMLVLLLVHLRVGSSSISFSVSSSPSSSSTSARVNPK